MSGGAGSGKDWVKGLDSLRFVLALIVFLSHLNNEVAIFLKSFDSKLFQFLGIAVNHLYLGPGAVVGFFIISGFVIHYPFKDTTLNVKQFLVRRWLRIGLPLLVAIVPAIYMGGLHFIPIWSLYCELIYYTIYPLLRKLPVSWKVQFCVAFVISLIVMFSFGADTELKSALEQRSIEYTGSYAALGDWLTWIIGLPCWLMGVLIADNIDKMTTYVSRVRIYVIRFSILVISAVVLGLKAHWFVSYLFTLNFFAFAAGYWIANEILFFRSHKPSAILEYTGKFSYSLYLLHVMLVSVLVHIFSSTLATYPLIIALTILLSYVFYLLVEYPSHRLSQIMGRKFSSEKG